MNFTTGLRFFTLLFLSIGTCATNAGSFQTKIQNHTNAAMIIHRVKPSDMLYPPLKLCYSHWLAWVNFRAVLEMNFTKSELYYAMSYLSWEIYSAERFDIKDTEQAFFRKLHNKNLSMTQFFLKIARKFDYMTFGKELPINFTTTLEPLNPREPWYNRYYTLCYTFAETDVAYLATSLRDQVEDSKNSYASKAEEHTINIYLTPFESLQYDDHAGIVHHKEKKYYMKYLSKVIGKNFKIPKHSGHKSFPVFVYINAYSPYPTLASLFTPIHATIKASVNIRSPIQAEYLCIKGRAHVLNDGSCYQKCKLNMHLDLDDNCYASDNRNFLGLNVAYFHFMNDKGKFRDDEIYPRCIPKMAIKNEHTDKAISECIKKCKQETGCIVWDYDVNIERVPFNGPASIQYPIPEHTVVFEDV